ncbi:MULTISPECIES: GPW/gp25 family protein [unclassified Corallococcus]|uniref:GPW/gp25 family protein n=1 Tax=Corallococcus TaxID=83461 RepID=UPI001CBC8D35|nr:MULTISPECIES: GPW/gp25 family protein [unclassified Corallococcus]MBZ4332970.1 GPW/gp25 family protein [Corallococcus sp. AS-1-12]MBZ4373777.1 GPW/gp25 family protein [Corallococcus sp. AS-1-6]
MLDDIRGFGFPFRIDSQTGGVSWAQGDQKIRQNVMLIIGTRRGERPMLREFGSQLHALTQSPNDQALAELIRTQARHALLQWEPRVVIADATVAQTEDTLHLRLNYFHTNEPASGAQITFPIG